GTQFSYCNPPMTILSEIVRRVSGESIGAYLRQHVWGPLGMSDTSFDPAGVAGARVSEVAASTWPEPPQAPVRYGLRLDQLLSHFRRVPQPAGGAWSTAADLIAFGRAYLHGLQGRRYNGTRVLTRATMEAMLRPHTIGLTGRQNGKIVPAQPRG